MAAQPETDHVAHATTTIAAPPDAVWRALTDPEQIRKYMFGATVTSDWTPGSPITWKGEMKGKPYEDKGTVQRVERGSLLQYTHYSPMSGAPDVPASYHTVTVALKPEGNATRVDLTQTRNPTDDARKHSEENWSQMLAAMKKTVEGAG